MPSEQSIKSFWNRAADDNPYWYVSSYGPYDADRSPEKFWASGRGNLERYQACDRVCPTNRRYSC